MVKGALLNWSPPCLLSSASLMIHGHIRKKAQVEGKWSISKGDEVLYFYSVFCQQITVYVSLSVFTPEQPNSDRLSFTFSKMHLVKIVLYNDTPLYFILNDPVKC